MSEKQNPNIGHLQALIESKGWNILKIELEKQLTEYTELALDPDNESLRETITLTKRDLMLKWREYTKMMIRKPEALIKFYEGGEAIEAPTDFDVYPKESDLEKR